MAQTKPGYRETIEWLTNRGFPALLSVREVQEICGCSYGTARSIVSPIKKVGGKIPIGAVARILCG